MQGRFVVGGFLVALFLLLAAGPLAAQSDTRDRRLPLGPNRPAGEAVAPFLEAWYANPDGTYTLSFGYFNFNMEQALEIPIGPNNRIEPSEFDGMQPTYFPSAAQGYDRHERGIFTVTVPADYANGARTVTWSLTANDETHTLTARVGAQALQADYSGMAVGSVPPYLSFTEGGGPSGQYPSGITLEETLTVQVGQPLTLSVWTRDPSERSRDVLGPLYRDVPVNIIWYRHQGPVGGNVTFERTTEPWRAPGEEDSTRQERGLEPHRDRVGPAGGESSVTAMFSAPGDYMVRVRADNFGAVDSSAGNQCCWTNGYFRVRVTQ